MRLTYFRLLIPALAASLLLLGGCGSKSWRSGGVVGSKPYSIRGKTYYPLQSAQGFIEEGVASWYGPGFHGRRTANGEVYDMRAMTAAHKILPLGTIVRVINRNNARALILRINDRGPFVDDRVIDLSRAAAEKLDVIAKGTAPVRITVIDNQAPPPATVNKAATRPPPDMTGDSDGRFFLQVGAFPEREDAQEMARQMEKLGYTGRYLYANSVERWRVQLGPLPSRNLAEEMKERLIDVAHDAFVVTDN